MFRRTAKTTAKTDDTTPRRTRFTARYGWVTVTAQEYVALVDAR